MRRVKAIAACSLFLGCLLSSPSVARGQNHVILRGQVLDSESQAPVAWAFVFQAGSDRGSLTDSGGRFALQLERGSSATVQVTQLGYHGLEVEVGVEDLRTSVTLHMEPDPIVLEGLTVLSERLAERRLGPFGSGEILDRGDLIGNSGGSGYDLLLQVLPFVEPCDLNSEELCLAGRGGRGRKKAVRVCMDDHQVPGPMMETALSGVDPRALYLVEVFSLAGEVRMYSPAYVRRLAEGGASLGPLSFGCGDGVGFDDRLGRNPLDTLFFPATRRDH